MFDLSLIEVKQLAKNDIKRPLPAFPLVRQASDWKSHFSHLPVPIFPPPPTHRRDLTPPPPHTSPFPQVLFSEHLSADCSLGKKPRQKANIRNTE